MRDRWVSEKEWIEGGREDLSGWVVAMSGSKSLSVISTIDLDVTRKKTRGGQRV